MAWVLLLHPLLLLKPRLSWNSSFLFLYFAYVADVGKCSAVDSTPSLSAPRNIILSPHRAITVLGATDSASLFAIYTLEAEECARKDMDLIISLESEPVKSSGSPDHDKPRYILLLNMEEGHNFNNSNNDSSSLSYVDNGTIIATTGMRSPFLDNCKPFTQLEQKAMCRQSYAFIKVRLSEYHVTTMPWYVGVSSIRVSRNYTLKAWCTPGSSMHPHPSKPCVSVGTLACLLNVSEGLVRTQEYQLYLPSDESGVEIQDITLNAGAWKYYTFNVSDSLSRILVEMSRSHGDVMLIVKPREDVELPKQSILPSEYDFDSYADKLSYQNRENHHYRYIIGTGLFLVGIHNNDACVKEPSRVNLTILTASPRSSSFLCPRNCSYPNGRCVSNILCKCEPHYGGKFCEGSLKSPKSEQNLSGWLLPGQVAYFKVQPNSSLLMKFSHPRNNLIILASEGDFPTLANHSLAYIGNTSDDFNYHLNGKALLGEQRIFGVFNLDYIFHQASFYDIVVTLPDWKGLSTHMLILAAVCSCFIMFFAIAIVERVFHQSNPQNSSERGTGDENASHHDGLDKAIIESFPKMLFISSNVTINQTQCSICLGGYRDKEELRRIPYCLHLFHAECLDKWLVRRASCPVCRLKLPPES